MLHVTPTYRNFIEKENQTQQAAELRVQMRVALAGNFTRHRITRISVGGFNVQQDLGLGFSAPFSKGLCFVV